MTTQITRGPSSADEPRFAVRDVTVAARLILQCLMAWTVPERLWPWLTERLAALRARLRPAHTQYLSHTFLARVLVLSGRAGNSMEAARDIDARHWEDQLQVFREWRPRGWCPRIQVRGWEYVEAALDSGGGAILWVAPAWSSSLVTKIAWHRAGLRVGHLSRTSHGGFGMRGRLGRRLATPLRTRVEERYADRIVIGSGGPVRALRELQTRLSANRLVSITMGDAAERVAGVPYFDQTVELGTGAPRLALATGAPLLPVCTRRDGVGRYTIDILPPLAAPAGVSRDDAVVALAAAAARAIEPFGGYPDRTRDH